MDKFSEELLRQTSLSLADTVKINKDRFDTARFALNQVNALMFICIGIKFDGLTGTGVPVISGAQYMTKEQTIHLLEKAIVALQPPLVLEDPTKGGEHGPM